METLQVKIEGDQKTLEIRTGDALPLKEPIKVLINGTLDAASRWIKDKNKIIDKNKANVIVNAQNGTIILNADENNHYGTVVIGTLKLSVPLQSFNINKNTTQSLTEMISLLKRNRYFFADKTQHAQTLSNLMSFKAKIQTEIEQSKDNRGNLTSILQKTVETQVPLSFKLQLPIFEGFKNYIFEVEIGFTATDADVKYFLESPDLIELLEKEKDALISIEVEQLKEFTIIYQ